MKYFKYLIICILLCPLFVYADGIKYISIQDISTNTIESNKEFESLTGGINILYVTGGESNFNNCTFKKSGDSTFNKADIYGTNSAIIIDNGVISLDNGSISADGKYASGVFAYGSGKANLNNVNINTLNNDSAAIVASEGGSISAKNLTVKTDGESSAAIKSYGENSEIVITGGKYETNGKNSPTVFSSGKVTITDAEMTSNTSEGLVIDNNGTIILEKVKIVDTNNIFGINSDNYKNIFLYQSMERIESDREATFTSKDSYIETNRGDSIVVTNTKANISLENTEFVNKYGAFLVIRSDFYGINGKNGGDVNLSITKQKINGNIVVDNISSLVLDVKNNSVLEGPINNENASKNVTINMSSDSKWSLTEDSYVKALNNDDEENNNIYSNGKYKLYVDGKEVKINESKFLADSSMETSKTNNDGGSNTWIIIICVLVVAIGIGVYFLVLKAKSNNSF